MKIVNRQDFLQQPAGILYSMYEPIGMIEGLYEKGDSFLNDWIYVDLLSTVDGECLEKLYRDESITEIQIDLECAGRDGVYDASSMFVIYDGNEVDRLINRLVGIKRNYPIDIETTEPAQPKAAAVEDFAFNIDSEIDKMFKKER